MSAVDNMATAVSKPTYLPKMKRPPPPFAQPGPNGVKPQASPQSSSKRLPGSGAPGFTPSVNGSVSYTPNGVTTKGSLNRSRKEPQRLDQSLRPQKPLTRTASAEIDRRVGKNAPEPYGERVLLLMAFVLLTCLQSKLPPTSCRNTPSYRRRLSCTFTRLISASSNKMAAFHITPK